MKTISDVRVTESEVVISLSGRIDATNAEEFDSELANVRADHPDGTMTIDASDLEYVSSAGLRVFLKWKKMDDSLNVTNVSRDVYDIFAVTGFSDIIPVKKKMREVDTEGMELIGQGGTGKVFRMDRETIVKEFFPYVPLEAIEQEKFYSQEVLKLGINTAISYEIVKCGEDSYGLIYELIDSETLGKYIAGEPERLDEYTKKYAKLVCDMNAATMDGKVFPNIKEMYRDKAEPLCEFIGEGEVSAIKRVVDMIPDANAMIHCDFHPANVMVQNRELVLIDMAEIGYEHPVFNLAGLYLNTIHALGPGLEQLSSVEITSGMNPDLSRNFWDHVFDIIFENYDAKEKEQALKQIQVVTKVRLLENLPLIKNMMPQEFIEKIISVNLPVVLEADRNGLGEFIF